MSTQIFSDFFYRFECILIVIFGVCFFCYILTFWPGPKCHSRWCTRRKWHIPMAVRRGNRVGGNWLMKWDELKKFPWYTHRLMHRKRVTFELHDSYFRLMTIKHSISKIELALNYYIALSRRKSGGQLSSRGSWQLSSTGQRQLAIEFDEPVEQLAVEFNSGVRVPVGVGRDVVGKATSSRRGLLALMSWGPEKMLIRCSKESQHPAEWTLGLRLSIKRTRKTQRDGHNSGGQNIAVYVRSPAPSHSKTPPNLFEHLQIKWEVNILLKKSSFVCCYCVGMYPAWTCICVYKHIYYVSI